MMTSTSNIAARQSPRTLMSRHDRIARIVQRVVQRCSRELSASARLTPVPAMVRAATHRF
jgi:hypothetical protein